MMATSSRPLPLFGFLALTLAGGWIVGFLSRPDDWYAALQKPSFNPANWVFAPVWTVLYFTIGVAGRRVFALSRDRGARMLWCLQLALNFLWSPVFFSAHAIGAALSVVTALWFAIAAFIARVWTADRASALLFIPYLVWVCFAALLNAAIWRLN